MNKKLGRKRQVYADWGKGKAEYFTIIIIIIIIII